MRKRSLLCALRLCKRALSVSVALTLSGQRTVFCQHFQRRIRVGFCLTLSALAFSSLSLKAIACRWIISTSTPEHQSKGIGKLVLAEVFSKADKAGLALKVGALKESDSNRFYMRHGFVLTEQAEFDNYYVRAARPMPIISDNYCAPRQIQFTQFFMAVLAPQHADQDFEAVRASADAIRHVFGPDNDWPAADISFEENLADLTRHEAEFNDRYAFAYALLDPTGQDYLGCF
jgi:hypothetical protein